MPDHELGHLLTLCAALPAWREMSHLAEAVNDDHEHVTAAPCLWQVRLEVDRNVLPREIQRTKGHKRA